MFGAAAVAAAEGAELDEEPVVHDDMKPPTPGELAILRVLWDRGPSSVREVHEALGEVHAVGYTTALKLLQIMLEKGMVERDESMRAHVYRARFPAATTERQLVADLRERAFGGSTAKLLMRALSDAPATAEELDEIRALLQKFESEGNVSESRDE